MKLFNKQVLLGVVTVVLLTTISSCRKDETVLKLSTNTCIFTPQGGEEVVVVNTNADKFVANLSGDESEHFQVIKQLDKLIIVADENTTDNILSAKITVTADNVTTYLHVKQSPLVAKSLLKVMPDINEYRFNSTGGSMVLNISTPGTWTAISSKSWCDVECDYKTGTLRISTNNYTGLQEQRASVVITVTVKNEQVRRVIDIVQGIKETDPYYMMLGDWVIWSDKWMVLGETIGQGERVFFKIEANELNESFYIKNIFFPGSVITVPYNPVEKTIGFRIDNWPVIEAGDSYYLLIQSNYTSWEIVPGYLTGEILDDNKTIKVRGLYDGCIWGMVLYEPLSSQKFTYFDTPYTQDSNVEFRKVSNVNNNTYFENYYSNGVEVIK